MCLSKEGGTRGCTEVEGFYTILEKVYILAFRFAAVAAKEEDNSQEDYSGLPNAGERTTSAS